MTSFSYCLFHVQVITFNAWEFQVSSEYEQQAYDFGLNLRSLQLASLILYFHFILLTLTIIDYNNLGNVIKSNNEIKENSQKLIITIKFFFKERMAKKNGKVKQIEEKKETEREGKGEV